MGMKTRMYRGSRWLRSHLPGACVMLGIAIIFVLSLNKTALAQKEETMENLEESIRRAAMVCYATEGRYPESFSYLRDNYGIMLNEENFAVHYSVFASNIMPEITVVEK